MLKKKQGMLVMISAALSLAAAAPALANGEPTFTRDFARSMANLKMMDMMDANKDHTVTKEEFMKYQGALFDMMDKNKDDKLDRGEWQAMNRKTAGAGTS